jgi:hypothetical protein
MPRRVRLVFASLSLASFLIVAIPLFVELSRRTDIWWTPHTMLVPLTGSADRVEIYARGESLTTLLQAGRLAIVEKGGSSPLAVGDVGLRFNNWDRVRAARLPMLLVDAAGCGVTGCLFLLVLTGRLAYRGDKEAIQGLK